MVALMVPLPMMKPPKPEQQRTVAWLLNRSASRPLDVLEAGQRALELDRDPAFRGVVLSLVHRTATQVVEHLAAQGKAAKLGGKSKAHYAALAQRLAVELGVLAEQGVVSSYLDQQDALQQQLYLAPDLEEFVEAYAARVKAPAEKKVARLARDGDVLEALQATLALTTTPGIDLLEVLAGAVTRALQQDLHLQEAGWEHRAEALAQAFAAVVGAHWLPVFLGEAAVAEVVSLALRTRKKKVLPLVKALEPISVRQPSLAFRLARLAAGRRDKAGMLRYLRRAFEKARDLFVVDDPEFGPYLKDKDLKALLKAFPTTEEMFA